MRRFWPGCYACDTGWWAHRRGNSLVYRHYVDTTDWVGNKEYGTLPCNIIYSLVITLLREIITPNRKRKSSFNVINGVINRLPWSWTRLRTRGIPEWTRLRIRGIGRSETTTTCKMVLLRRRDRIKEKADYYNTFCLIYTMSIFHVTHMKKKTDIYLAISHLTKFHCNDLERILLHNIIKLLWLKSRFARYRTLYKKYVG